MGLKTMPEDIMEMFKDEINESLMDLDAFGTSMLWMGEDDKGDVVVKRIHPGDVELKNDCCNV